MAWFEMSSFCLSLPSGSLALSGLLPLWTCLSLSVGTRAGFAVIFLVSTAPPHTPCSVSLSREVGLMSEAELLVLVAACELVWTALVRFGSEALPSPGELVNDRLGGFEGGLS